MAFDLGTVVRRVQRGLGFTETEALGFVSRLVPTVDLAELLGDASSDSFGYRFAGGTRGLAALAGNINTVYISNPTGSGTTVVVTQCVVDAASDVVVGTPTTGGGARSTNAQGFRDTGMAGEPTGFLNVLQQVGGDVADFIDLYPAANTSPRVASHRDPLYIVRPGGSIAFSSLVANEAITVSALWTEIGRGTTGGV